ncbi:MAG: hypothetical protein WD066_01110 [Planctomycetaceae bacterium]
MAKRDRLAVEDRRGAVILDFGDMEIWDGADLCLLRETLTGLMRQKRRTVGIDMSHVMYVPSGFFGMLLDFRDKGATVYVDGVTGHVRNMLWFKEFFDPHDEERERFLLRGEPKQVPAPAPLRPGRPIDWLQHERPALPSSPPGDRRTVHAD